MIFTIMIIYIYLWVNYNDLTATEPWNHGYFFGKSSLFLAARFRLVKYHNLPIYIYIAIDIMGYNPHRN